MPGSAPVLGAFYGLLSALVWGSGDFAGGLATRRASVFRVLVLTSLVGLLVLLLIALALREPWPSWADLAWAAAAGTSGAVGLAALYRGLSMRTAAIVAPTSAVVGALFPVVVSLALAGLPTPTQSAGILIGLGGIWLVTRSELKGHAQTREGLILALASGVCFGGYIIFISRVSNGSVFAPLAAAKAVATVVALGLLAARRLPLLSPRENPVALAAGVLDAGGNVFFLLASRVTRLDVAAVFSSMGPAVTVVFSALLIHERVSRRQWLGVGVCLLATALLAI
ncbi:MAG: DMT family transporter [Chloroflexi bacterium]|nr:DMT family transporter [Chloroflexota bacterium]